MAERQPPRYTGVDTYLDPKGRFSFRYNWDWQQLDLEGREGVRFLPNPADPDTSFTAWVSQLEHYAVAEDLEALRRAVDEGLGQLAGSSIEESSAAALGNLLKYERIYTFREDGALRKRKVWILYVSEWLIVLTWQGSSPEEYKYWLAMANYCFATFTIPEALWFATDRDLWGAGHPPTSPPSP